MARPSAIVAIPILAGLHHQYVRIWIFGKDRRHEFPVMPETAVTRMAARSQPRTPMTEKTNIWKPVNRSRLGSLKKSVNSLLISMPGTSRARLAPQHQAKLWPASSTPFDRARK